MHDIVQSILFNKYYGWNLQEAVRWLIQHGYKSKKIDETEHNFRFRQISPNTLKKRGYDQFRLKEIAEGIEFIIAFKRNTPMMNYI